MEPIGPVGMNQLPLAKHDVTRVQRVSTPTPAAELHFYQLAGTPVAPPPPDPHDCSGRYDDGCCRRAADFRPNIPQRPSSWFRFRPVWPTRLRQGRK